MRKNSKQVIIENYFEPCILFAIMKKPSYGYDIQKELKEKCICDVNIGNLYRCLNRFEKSGYIAQQTIKKSEVGPARKLYKITKIGKEYLSSWVHALQDQKNIINSLLVQYENVL